MGWDAMGARRVFCTLAHALHCTSGHAHHQSPTHHSPVGPPTDLLCEHIDRRSLATSLRPPALCILYMYSILQYGFVYLCDRHSAIGSIVQYYTVMYSIVLYYERACARESIARSIHEQSRRAIANTSARRKWRLGSERILDVNHQRRSDVVLELDYHTHMQHKHKYLYNTIAMYRTPHSHCSRSHAPQVNAARKKHTKCSDRCSQAPKPGVWCQW